MSHSWTYEDDMLQCWERKLRIVEHVVETHYYNQDDGDRVVYAMA